MRYPLKAQIASALTLIGRRWQIDAHYFAKNSFLVLISQGVGILRGLVGGYLVARFFSQEMYGEYQFMLGAMGMIGILAIPGIATPVARAWSRGESFSLGTITRHQLMVASVGSFLLVAAIPFLGMYGKQDLWPLFLTAAIIFPLPPIAMVYFGSYTVGTSRFGLSLKATIVWSVISIVATAFIILFYQSALLMLVTSTVIPPLVYLWMSRNIRPPPEKDPEDTKKIIRYAWQLSLASLPADLVWYLDKMLISYFFGLNQLAVFSVALLIPENLKTIAKQFFPVAFAKQSAKSDTRERRMHLVRIVFSGAAFLAVAIALYVVVTPWIMPFLFPGYDARTLALLSSITAITLVTLPSALFTQYLEARGMIWEVRMSTWVAAGTFAVALVALVPIFGPLGAVLARGVFRFANAGMACWYVLRAPIRTV